MFLNMCLNLFLYGGISIRLNEEIVNFFNSSDDHTIFVGDFFFIKLNRFVFFAVELFFPDSADVPGNLFLTGRTVLARRVDRNNSQRLRIPDLCNIFGPFFFEK